MFSDDLLKITFMSRFVKDYFLESIVKVSLNSSHMSIPSNVIYDEIYIQHEDDRIVIDSCLPSVNKKLIINRAYTHDFIEGREIEISS